RRGYAGAGAVPRLVADSRRVAGRGLAGGEAGHVRFPAAGVLHGLPSHAAVLQQEHRGRLRDVAAGVEPAGGLGVAAGARLAGRGRLAAVFAARWLMWKPWRCLHPGLLGVLHIAFTWLPVAFVLFCVQDLALAIRGEQVLGPAPLHALAIGFFGSMLVAMVTRVTHGHSGRPLQMHPV